MVAWVGVGLSRKKRLPTLKKILGRDKAKAPTQPTVARARKAHADIVERLGHIPDHPDGVVVAFPAPDSHPGAPEGPHGALSTVSGDSGDQEA